ncbi:Nramp family divalent metal transporter [Candidatus Palauibacter sp.]|uniref:Nramp family divalent metal transporter n=1 Tax=Candidatus Palauibacter sp. TaxID=3101350 RepID=UPI003B593B10
MPDLESTAADGLNPDDLALPSLRPRDLLAHFGPGMILMMTGIGTSHLVTAPTAGGRFAYALLWCLPVAYVFKYYGFEMAFRFTNATGKSLLEAYATARWKWPLWYVMVTTLVQCAIGQAGRLIAAAAVLYYLFSEFLGLSVPLEGYAALLGLLSVAIILRGSYRAVEHTTKVLAGVLVLSSLAVYFVQPAPLAQMGHFFLVEIPEGSWLVIAGFLGLLPTGIDVSLQASEWGKAKRAGMSKIRPRLEEAGVVPRFDPFSSPRSDLAVDISRLSPHAREYCRRWFRIGLWDFRTGHVVSFVLAAIFVLLAAVWLYPSPIAGHAVMGEIAGIFTLSVGPWMMVVFVLGALAATHSTAFNYFDGWPRIVGACCRNLFRPTARLHGISRADRAEPERRKTWYSEYNIYRMTMFYSLIASVLYIAFDPRPVYLVLVASALAFFVAPVIYFFNLYYCLKVIPKDDALFYPSWFARWFGGLSLLIFTGLSVILIFARVFEIPLFGA